jgi:hypothetical protein
VRAVGNLLTVSTVRTVLCRSSRNRSFSMPKRINRGLEEWPVRYHTVRCLTVCTQGTYRCAVPCIKFERDTRQLSASLRPRFIDDDTIISNTGNHALHILAGKADICSCLSLQWGKANEPTLVTSTLIKKATCQSRRRPRAPKQQRRMLPHQ